MWQAARAGSENRLAVQATPEGKNNQWFYEHIYTAGFPGKIPFERCVQSFLTRKIENMSLFISNSVNEVGCSSEKVLS